MTEVLDLRRADDPRDVIHRVCEALSAGRLVALPTETRYTLAALSLSDTGIRSLSEAAAGEACELIFKTAEEARDFLDGVPSIGQKLLRRCWPGPVSFAVAQELTSGLWKRLPAATQSLLLGNGDTVRMRVPAHAVWTEVLRLLPAPLVALADPRPGTTTRRNATDLAESWGDCPALIVDDGAGRFSDPVTVAHLSPLGWEVCSPGVMSARNLTRLASEVFLFVCTGNTCRSPMAEALFRRELARRLGCADDDVVDRGYIVASAGLAAAVGAPASREAVELLADEGVDLREHESQPLTERLLNQADRIYTMTRHHRQAILAERPDLEDRVQPLAADRSDISDPIGAGRAAYERCKADIERHVRSILDQFLPEPKSTL